MRENGSPLRILTVIARPLYPADTGGRIRSSKLFEHLSRMHDVTILCFKTAEDGPAQLEQMRACCSHLEAIDWDEAPKFTPRFYAQLAASLWSPLPFTVRKYRSAAMRRRVEELTATERYDLLLCDFLQPAVNCLSAIHCPRVLFQHNVEAVIFSRHAAYERNPAARAFLRLEAAKLKRFEGRVAATFDRCIMVSNEDCRTMQAEYGVENTSAIPSAVDSRYFSDGSAEATEPTIVFVGSMDWLPNQDAVEYFVSAILPRIRREVSARFVVVGRNPPPRIQRLALAPLVQVTGTVEDVRPWVAAAHVVVVPLRVGGGTRLKIFEAMALGKAVVSTTVGAEGLPVTNTADILFADDAESFAAQVTSLLKNASVRKQLGERARRVVSQGFTWEAAASEFSRICTDVVRHSRAQQR